MDVANGTVTDRRTLARSPYVARLEALGVGERFRVPAHHRTRIASLATRWGKKWGRQFRTSQIARTVCLVGRIA